MYSLTRLLSIPRSLTHIFPYGLMLPLLCRRDVLCRVLETHLDARSSQNETTSQLLGSVIECFAFSIRNRIAGLGPALVRHSTAPDMGLGTVH